LEANGEKGGVMGLTELIAEGLDVSGCCFDWDSLPVIERKVVLFEPEPENFLYVTNREMKSILSGHSILNSDSFLGITQRLHPKS
jgi:hypothetical protein